MLGRVICPVLGYGLGLGVESSSGGGRNVHRCTGQRSKVKGQSELRNVINYYSRCFKLLSFFYNNKWYTPWVKKQDTKLLAITSLTIIRCSKFFFTSRMGSKFATNSCLNIPPRFKHVATLPCEIRMQKNGTIVKYVLQFTMNHKVV